MEFSLYVSAEMALVRESVKGIIWTIFFNRLFGPITPGIREFETVPYPIATNMPELERLIDQKVQNLLDRFDFTKARTGGRIVVQFMDKSPQKRKSSWFGKESENTNVWESWVINVNSSRQTVPHSTSVHSFERCLHKILSSVDEHKEHIPPITSLDSAPFVYRISIEDEGDDSWGGYIKKMLD